MRTMLALVCALTLSACVIDLSDDTPGDPGSGRSCGGFAGLTCDSDEYCDYFDDLCGIADGGGTCKTRPQVCTDIYAPVRGSDGQVYPNACEAHAHGADDCGPIMR